jgi:polyhydroxyalkanoate synthesis regulator phasin
MVMLDVFEKSLLFSLGAASLTKNKVEDLFGDLVKQAKLSPEEGRKVMDNILDQGKKANEELTERIEEVIKTRGHSLLPCNATIKQLQAKIDNLEERLRKLEDPGS